MKTKIITAVVAVVVITTVLLVVLFGVSKNRAKVDYSAPVQRPSTGIMSSNLASSGVSDMMEEYTAPMAPMSLQKEAAVDSKPVPGGSNVGSAQQNERLIIRTGQLSVVSKDVRKSVDEVSSFATSIGGFVVSSQVTGAVDNLSATLQIRVPVEKFQDSIDKAEKSGIRVTSKSMTGDDVTEDFVDTQARIKNLQASEAQFAEIMKNAQKITDVLEVQRQLERVRGEIEVAQGHAQYLEKSAKLSSITVYFATDESQLPVVDPVSSWSPLNIIKSAFRVLISVVQGLGTLLIWLVIFIPVWLLIAIVVYVIKRMLKRRAITQ
jgi:hypothetical protein